MISKYQYFQGIAKDKEDVNSNKTSNHTEAHLMFVLHSITFVLISDP